MGVLAILPFLWLVVLHYTLGRLVDELRETPPAAPSEEVETLRGELEALRQVVSRVEDQLGQARASEPSVGRTAPPARPVEQGLADDEDDDAGEDTGDETGGTGDEAEADEADPDDDDDARERPRENAGTKAPPALPRAEARREAKQP